MDKKLIKRLKYAGGTILAMVILYAVISFSNYDFNVVNWERSDRGFLGAFVAVYFIVYFVWLKYDIDKIKNNDK